LLAATLSAYDGLSGDSGALGAIDAFDTAGAFG
jgi:hypothetical protein